MLKRKNEGSTLACARVLFFIHSYSFKSMFKTDSLGTVGSGFDMTIGTSEQRISICFIELLCRGSKKAPVLSYAKMNVHQVLWLCVYKENPKGSVF